jgi:S-adenosylmethionine decarboxylase
MVKKIIGKQLLIDLAMLNQSICMDGDAWRDAFIKASKSLGLQVITSYVHVFKPPKALGITSYVLLDSSHFSIHTYAEAGKAAVDLFACTEGDLSQAFKIISEDLEITENNVVMMKEIMRFTEAE